MSADGGRMLIYAVGEELYASPLDGLREVLDVSWPPAEAHPVVHGHPVTIVPLHALLGEPPSAHIGEGGTRPLLVVEVASRWIGLLVDRLEGMVAESTVHPVPDGITELPEGSLAGALVLPGGETSAARRIVLVLNVERLAGTLAEEEHA